MNSERWQKIKGLFDAASEIAPAKRERFLANACGDDVNLCREVEKLLASFENAESFMEKPAAAEVASLIVDQKGKLKSGQQVAHYKTLRQIGEGGMGEVYLARDEKLNRQVALKVLPANLTSDKSRLQRFEQEAQAASALNHPNIITIYEIGESSGVHFIATEFVEGETLRQKISDKNLSAAQALEIAIQIASALTVAHSNNVVHRDIKPENLMIRPDGIVKLLDFGLAKLTETSAKWQAVDAEEATRKFFRTKPGMVMGTVNYMSPEQAQGLPIDHRTDLWSLGVCLYEMLAGVLPFSGKTVNHTLVAIMEKKPLPLSQRSLQTPAELERIVTKLLAKDRKRRYQTANDLLANLRELQKKIESETDQAETRYFPATTAEQFSEEEFAQEIADDIPPNNLSVQLSPLVGRRREISEITSLLRRDSIRLVTLTGIGGTGKTRLALEIAAEMLAEFADGVFFIALAAVKDAEFVASEIAQPLGVKESGGKSLPETLKNFLKEKQILLVVDNFEQVLSAAPILNELLAAAPRVQMLVTSRALLHLRVEREFVVPPLDVPADIAELSLDDLLQYESVKLFTERAQTVKSNLAATKENLQIIAEICSRLDGLPLAIELAAERIKILSPLQILERLENRLKLLTGGAQDLPTRQQTMRGTIEWSYDLLDENEQILFRRLAVFAGGFTIDAAESFILCHSSVVKDLATDEEQPTKDKGQRTIDVLNGITSLVENSLVVQRETADGESRFRLLEVVREYALEILETSGESEMMRKNHTAFFLALAEKAKPDFFYGQEIQLLNRLEEEIDNFRTALSWSIISDIETAANLAAALRRFWLLHGHLTEERKWLEAVLEKSDDAPIEVRVKLIFGLGQAALYQGDNKTAWKMFEESLAFGKAANDKRQIALSSRGLGSAAKQQGDIKTAKKFMKVGLKISRELKDIFGISVSLNNLGDLARMENDFAAARLLLEESLAISKQLENAEGVCGNLNNLGAVTYGEGNYETAHTHFSEAIALGQNLGDKVSVSYSLDGFAALAVKQENFECAAKLAGAAQHLRESLGFETEPAERSFRDAYLADLQSILDKEKFAEFYEQGRALSLKKAAALAL